jgi:hypothetical protein
MYNIFSCNNEIIIPCVGNRFLVSSNGANGTWRVVKYDSGFIHQGNQTPLVDTGGDSLQGFSFFSMFYYYNSVWPIGLSAGNGGMTSGIIHNGDVYIMQGYYGQLYYSKDLRTWFRKDDYLTPTHDNSGAPSYFASIYRGIYWPTAIPSLKKVVMGSKYLGGIFSFTTTGAYTAATQFPVPEIGADINYTKAFSTSWVPLKTYIKT